MLIYEFSHFLLVLRESLAHMKVLKGMPFHCQLFQLTFTVLFLLSVLFGLEYIMTR